MHQADLPAVDTLICSVQRPWDTLPVMEPLQAEDHAQFPRIPMFPRRFRDVVMCRLLGDNALIWLLYCIRIA